MSSGLTDLNSKHASLHQSDNGMKTKLVIIIRLFLDFELINSLNYRPKLSRIWMPKVVISQPFSKSMQN